MLRPANAGANTASDHIALLARALEQLPGAVVTDSEIVVCTDSAAARHEFTDDLADANIRFLLGYDLTETVRSAILALPESAWRPAIRQDGQQREGAWVAELSGRLDLAGWPTGTRVIVRRERPHPGAQLSFQDHDGHRFLATITNLSGKPVELERLDRGRANAEDRVRAAKQTDLDNLPFQAFDHNAVWLELSLIAQDLTTWTQRLALDGELAVCEPKTLRYRLLHTAARLVFHARRATPQAPTRLALGRRPGHRPSPGSATCQHRHATAAGAQPFTTNRRRGPTTGPRHPPTTPHAPATQAHRRSHTDTNPPNRPHTSSTHHEIHRRGRLLHHVPGLD
jgi:hypothetical protein